MRGANGAPSDVGGKTRVVLVGYGAINRHVVSLLSARNARVSVEGVITSAQNASTILPEGARWIVDAADLKRHAPDIVVEAANACAVRTWGAAALQSASKLIVSSTGALIDDDLLLHLIDVAKEQGSQLVLSPGAIAGVDALAAASRLSLTSVMHRIIKRPSAWGSAEDSAPHISIPTVIFSGSAREAARLYPKNANVTATVGLATVGLDRTFVELVADPNIARNCHEIEVEGSFGGLSIRIDNEPIAANPRSSQLAALALVRLLENQSPGLCI